MARLKVTINPVHADGSTCSHKVRPSGKPADPAAGCTGRARYRVTCSGCPWTDEPPLRVLAEEAVIKHRNDHLAGRINPCVFCTIVAGLAPATVVRAWPDALAILPRSGGVTDGHVLVIPRTHVPDVGTDPAVSAATMAAAAELAGELPAANVITSKGAEATQSVYHLHLHVVPRQAGDGLPLPWTPQQTARAAAAQNGADVR